MEGGVIEFLGYWIYPLLFFIATLAFTISTVGGGGGALILLPCSHFLVGSAQTAPILNLGSLIGRPVRLLLFWKSIDWSVVVFYMPSAIAGAVLGAYFFSNIELVGLQIIIALFLISTVFQYRWGKKSRSFTMKKIYFLPIGFIVSLISTMVGATGPILNPFYLNAGIEKENMIATKAANAFFMGLIQISSYTFFGAIDTTILVLGLCIGLGASAGNIIGKKLLNKMTPQHFREIVITIMFLTGFFILLKLLIDYFRILVQIFTNLIE